MAHPRADLPDFLHNSPYIPLGTTADDVPPPKVPNPTLRQIVASKRVRNILLVSFFLVVGYNLAGRIQNLHPLNRLGLSGPSCYFLPPVEIPSFPGNGDDEGANAIDWEKVAYVTYATDIDYLCNSVMLFERLQTLRSRAKKVLLFPREFLDKGEQSVESILLGKKKSFGVDLVPVDVMEGKGQYKKWAKSYTKLLAFNLTSYSRLIVLDSDSTLLSHLDPLFLLPQSPAILPQAYWLDKPTLSSHIMLITPAQNTFSEILNQIKRAKKGAYDMEIVNRVFGSSCSILPHEHYALLTGEFRSQEHEKYLGRGRDWDADQVIKDAKLVHFSDYPFPKPWMVSTDEEVERARPKCVTADRMHQRGSCKEEEIWWGLFEDFRTRRKDICGLGLAPNPHD